MLVFMLHVVLIEGFLKIKSLHMISAVICISLCRVWHPCNLPWVYAFLGSFLLQDMFLSLQVFVFKGQNRDNAKVGIKRVMG